MYWAAFADERTDAVQHSGHWSDGHTGYELTFLTASSSPSCRTQTLSAHMMTDGAVIALTAALTAESKPARCTRWHTHTPLIMIITPWPFLTHTYYVSNKTLHTSLESFFEFTIICPRHTNTKKLSLLPVLMYFYCLGTVSWGGTNEGLLLGFGLYLWVQQTSVDDLTVLTALSRPARLTNTLTRLSVTPSSVQTLTCVLTVWPEATRWTLWDTQRHTHSASQRDSHKPPAYHLKYLVFRRRKRLLQVWNMCNDNIFISGWSIPLSVCVCVCVCVCVYIYIYIHTHTHIYAWV